MKFEIKAHDGPGRFGKLDGAETPLVLNKNQIKIAPDEAVSYDIEREIAAWSVRETIAKAKEAKEADDDIELGYKAFIIANADDLILHPRDLVELISSLRRSMKSSSLLIYPFAEAQFIPLLAYMGVDAFFDDAGEYYSYLNVLVSPTKDYDLNTYHLYEMTQEELAKYNKNTIDFVLREVREHMKNSSLRNQAAVFLSALLCPTINGGYRNKLM